VALLSAVPEPDPHRRKKRIILKGDIPSPANPPSGCRFHTRCWLREQLGRPERCSTEEPELRNVGAAGQQAACHFSEEISPTAVQDAVSSSSPVTTAS
jgi:oligopeptide transport system ATP-binding protein